MDDYGFELIMLFIIFGVNLLFIIGALRKNTQSLRNYQNIPPLEVPLEGMYVKMKGHVASRNAFQTPINRYNVAFYQFQVFSSYSAKRRSPGRGYEVVNKNLFTEYSKERILIDKKNNIFIEINNRRDLLIKLRESVLNTPTALPEYPKHGRATKYIYEEQYLKEGDYVVVSGRLVKENDAYIITHTHSQKLPFIIQLQDDKPIIDAYLRKIKINIALIAVAILVYYYLRQIFI